MMMMTLHGFHWPATKAGDDPPMAKGEEIFSG